MKNFNLFAHHSSNVLQGDGLTEYPGLQLTLHPLLSAVYLQACIFDQYGINSPANHTHLNTFSTFCLFFFCTLAVLLSRNYPLSEFTYYAQVC